VKADAELAQTALAAAAAAENSARQAHKGALRQIETARAETAAAKKHEAATAARLSALEEALLRLDAARDEASEKHAHAKAALAQLDAPAELTARLDMARAAAAHDRAAVAEASAELQAHMRDAETRAKRFRGIEEERQSWHARGDRAGGQISALEARREEATEELRRIAEAPEKFLAARQTLMRQIEAADEARKQAADNRAEAESRLAGADRAARDTLVAMSMAREEKARSEARIEAARARCGEIAHMIATELDCTEAELFGLARVAPGDGLPPAEEVEKRLDGLKDDRERLGGVNLRAEEELNDILTSKTNLSTEYADLTEAIRRLRQAIQSLNKEGRERLLGAFDAVHAHFKELFVTLFGGGSAELQLIESDDPLEAGLEILARPPGKKPQVMTLLSGGEQALTALALIFAIFLTNPAPVCVLDEVDAPLDDANVERFCDLLDNMRGKTETRFLTVTHNPITMARMNRLFGVTMAERGVSQLVSVDLEEAERFRDTG
jgi:chromosome segregation protein